MYLSRVSRLVDRYPADMLWLCVEMQIYSLLPKSARGIALSSIVLLTKLLYHSFVVRNYPQLNPVLHLFLLLSMAGLKTNKFDMTGQLEVPIGAVIAVSKIIPEQAVG